MNSAALKTLIGKRVRFADRPCIVIEIMDSPQGPLVVIQDREEREIQSDRHGDAHRRVPRTHTAPWYIGDERNPELRPLWEFVDL